MPNTITLHRLTIAQLCLTFIICLSILSSVTATAQTIEIRREPNLKSFEAYYQLQANKELYIQIKAEGNYLKMIQQWDYKEILLKQTSELGFESQQPGFKLLFSKDQKGSISSVMVNGRDFWVKDNTYKPEPIPELSPAQITALKNTLDLTANALIKAINSNSAADVQQFIKTHVSEAFIKSGPVDLATLLPAVFRVTGGLQASKNTYLNTKAAIAEYKTRSPLESIYTFNIRLDKDDKIKAYNHDLGPDPVALNMPKGDSAFVQSLRATLATLVQKDIFSGTVLLAKGDKVLFQFASGVADKEKHQKINADTRFNLGSMNKMFTSLSIMQLSEKGKLSLSDPVSKFVDTTWMPKALADKITIHHLLSHTSGMGDMFRDEFEKALMPGVVNLNALKPFIKVKQLNFEPGKKWDYSNAGMFLLGAVIENVSGINYFDYIRQHIYQPAGMTQSDVYDINTNPHNLAIGYTFKADGTFQHNRNSMWTRGSPAGGGYSNLRDLYNFALALTAGKLVSAESQQKMYNDYMRKEYGYGFQVFNHKNRKIVGHSGGAPGVNAVALVEPKSGYVMVILSNYDNAVQGLQTFMLNRLKANLD